jgi:predicted transcriptional regulator
MNDTTQLILDIAERLPSERQQLLLEIARDLARPSRFFDSMSETEKAELDRSIEEADRGETISHDELIARLTSRFQRRGNA